MKRFELSISVDYIISWGFWEAYREIYQNIIDEINTNKESKMHVFFDQDKNVLTIGNTGKPLEKKTLLLGYSTKADDKNQIGQYGEGYKLALLVLIRAGHKVEIYNGHEKWTPKIIKSRRYNTEIMVVDVEKNNTEMQNGITFRIENVTESLLESIKDYCLDLSVISEKIETVSGTLLLDEKFSKKVYVNGLYVCTIKNSKMKYGYNFKPERIDLDRDRKQVTAFNLFWETSAIFSEIIDKELHFSGAELLNMLDKDMPEVEYIKNHRKSSVSFNEFTEMAYKDFKSKYGIYAIPVESEYEAQKINELNNGQKPVVVSRSKKDMIKASAAYSNYSRVIIMVKKPHDYLTEFKDEYLVGMEQKTINQFDKIIALSKFWGHNE